MIMKTEYMCIGENFGKSPVMGCCGQSQTLNHWLQRLTGRSETFLDDYFEGFKDPEIVKYIFDNFGKRLVKLKGRVNK